MRSDTGMTETSRSGSEAAPRLSVCTCRATRLWLSMAHRFNLFVERSSSRMLFLAIAYLTSPPLTSTFTVNEVEQIKV